MRMIRDVVPDIGIVDSFFVTAIETGRKAELFLTQDVLNKHEKVLIPVNRENHWSLVVSHMLITLVSVA